jgi:hypothetical protein
MESAKMKAHYNKNKSIIDNNKLECSKEYQLNDFNTKDTKKINNNNIIIKDILVEIQKVQNKTNDELYEFKNKTINNKMFFKNEKNKKSKNDNKELDDKLNQKDSTQNNMKNKKNICYKDIPLTSFFK